MSSTAGSPANSVRETLEARIIAAHEAGDGVGLAKCYGEAADSAETEGDIDRACFFLTQAMVFALEAGLASAADFEGRLRAYGRV
jgi:hypothetical protein